MSKVSVAHSYHFGSMWRLLHRRPPTCHCFPQVRDLFVEAQLNAFATHSDWHQPRVVPELAPELLPPKQQRKRKSQG